MTESRKLVLIETALVALGVAVGTALMCVVYGLLGKFAMPVLLGGIVGFIVATGNFFSLALVATIASDKAEAGDPEGAQKLMKSSYPLRMIAMAGILFVCAKSGYFDVIALVLPLVFVRPVLTIREFFRKKGD